MSEDLLSMDFIVNAFRGLKEKKRQYKTYILRDKAANIYKIGRAVNIDKRIKSLSIANINLAKVMVINKDIEVYLHTAYKSKQIESEWFNLSKEDLEDIKNKYSDYLL